MSLFAGLFAAPKQAGSPGGATLFSSSSKYAAQPLAAPAAAAAAAPEPGGGKKKKRKQEAAEAPAAPAAAAAEPSSKKSRKAQEQRRQQGQEERQQQADKAAAAAAAAAAAVPAEGEKKASKKRKQQQGEQQEQQGAAAPAAAAPATAAEGPSAKASGKPGKRDKALKPKPAAAAAEAAAEEGGSKAAGKAGGKAAEPAAAPKGKGGKAEAPSDERLPRTVFVGNLPATVKTKKIARLFAAAGCGAVESVRLRSLPLKQEPESKLPRKNAIAAGKIDSTHSAHAYVVFEEEAGVDKALALNMTEFEGHHIRVDRAAPASAKGAVAFDHMRTLFVGNLPHDCEDEELIRHFGAAAVEAVRIVRDGKTGAGKGVAFVLFRSQEASKAALRGKGRGELRGRQLRLTVAKKQAAAGGKPAAWQQGKDSGGKGGGKSGKPAAAQRKAGGKRPAVAARKAAAKLAAKGGVQKKRAA